MCILLTELDYAKFGVSNIFFYEVIEEKSLRGSAQPLLLKEGLRQKIVSLSENSKISSL